MSVITLRPTGTLSATGDPGGPAPTVVGAATFHQALADDLDTSYASFVENGQEFDLSLADVTLTAGAVLKAVRLRIRVASVTVAGSSSARFTVSNTVAFKYGYAEVWRDSTTPTTIVVGERLAGTYGVADINASTFRVSFFAPNSADGRVHEAYLDVIQVLQPTTVVNAPTGTITNTNMPLVSWTNTLDADGGEQTSANVRIFTAAQYGIAGFDPATSPATASETVGTATSFQGTAPLANGVYRAYVQVAQTIQSVSGQSETVTNTSHWSPWAFSQFTIDVAAPAAPTITATPENTAGRVNLTVTGTGATTTDAIELERSNNAGATWVKVRNTTALGGRIAGSTASVVDYESPDGAALYRARGLRNYSGVYAAGPWAQAAATLALSTWWLKHPNRPALNMAITLRSYATISRAVRQGIFQGLGATLPTVVSDTPGGARGQIVVLTATGAQRDTIEALFASNATLLLHGPASHGEPDRYVRFGDIAATRLVDNANFHWRDVTWPWVQVAQPAGAQTGAQYTAPASSGEELIVT